MHWPLCRAMDVAQQQETSAWRNVGNEEGAGRWGGSEDEGREGLRQTALVPRHESQRDKMGQMIQT